MKILLVLTGGTICSARNNDGLNDLNTEAASLTLVSLYRESLLSEMEKNEIPDDISSTINDDITFESIAPINTLSENMTVDKWNQLIKALKEVDFSQYAGIIMLHGTDTLHLTSALMGVLLADIGIPVMMVSAHRILDDPESNGVDNFTKSVSLIQKLASENKGGVYVVYRNVNGVSFVHHATHLEECGDYSEDFYSSDMIEYDRLMKDWDDQTWINNENGFLTENKEDFSRGDEIKSSSRIIDSVGIICDDVLYVRPYVGINYDRYNLKGVRAVLHGMYHSSTINTEGIGTSSALSLLERCNREGVTFYIFPCKDGDYRYSTTKPLIENGAKCIYGMTWEEAYVRLLLKI